MAGHNKWSKIKRQKAKEDKRKSKVFSKLIREITVAAREKGGDPEYNPRLRLAVDQAKAENMPKNNIQEAIKRGTGELEGVDYSEATYEGYGPGGVALFLECLTDNANRTVQDVRHALDAYGGNLGTSGSVAWQFERKGEIRIDASRYTENAVLEAALMAGAEDVRPEDGEFVVTTAATDFQQVRDTLGSEGLEWSSAELALVARNDTLVSGGDARKLVNLLDALDDLDDVQKIWTNAEIDEDALAEQASETEAVELP